MLIEGAVIDTEAEIYGTSALSDGIGLEWNLRDTQKVAFVGYVTVYEMHTTGEVVK